jgi:hypothetical protein
MVLGVRRGNLYRLRGQPMRVVTSRSRETDEEEQVAPPVMRQVAPLVVPAQREPELRGSQPSGSSREEQPPRTIQRRLDFRGGQQVQREQMAPEIVQTQREF